jgi:ATP-dependent helicase/nuclease subunit A
MVYLPTKPIQRHPAPNVSQAEAITNLSQNLVVSAGAGSGKTWVLTERYIEMLSKGIKPSQIVAITFTEKAAAEMRMRIRKAVHKRVVQAESEEELHFWEQMKNELQKATITTIHGFCSRLIRDNPLEAGMDPQAKVLDAVEAEILLNDSITEVVDQAIASQTEGIRQLYMNDPSKRSIMIHVNRLYQTLRTYHKTTGQAWSETVLSLEARKKQIPAKTTDLNRLVGELAREVGQALLENKKKPPKYLENASRWLEQYEGIQPSLLQWDGWMSEGWSHMLSFIPREMWNRDNGHIKELRLAVQQCFMELAELGEAPHYRSIVQTLLDLVEQTRIRYEKSKKERQSIDFGDLEDLALSLLEREHEVAKRWQSKLAFLMVDEFQDTNGLQKGIIDAITDRGQKVTPFVVGDGKQSIYKFRGADVEVFQQIGEEICNQGGQSIQLNENFRTQSRIIEYINSFFHFLMKRDDEAPLYKVGYEPLRPFRSPEHRNAAVELLCLDPDKSNSLDPSTPTDDSNQSESAFIDPDSDVNDEQETGVGKRRREAIRIAERILQMVAGQEPLVWEKPADERIEGKEKARAVQYKDVAILFSNKTHVKTYEIALQEAGIPYVVHGGQSFYEKQEVLDLITVLKVIANPDDDVSLVGFLRSPLVHISDEALFWMTRAQSLREAFYQLAEMPELMKPAEWDRVIQARTNLSIWTTLRKVDGLGVLLRRIVEDTGFIEILLGTPMGVQKAANVEKCIHMAKEIVDKKGHDLMDFLHFIQLMRTEEVREQEAEVTLEQGNQVQLMTIHASKGLEFPVVFLPHLDRNLLSSGGSGPAIIYRPGLGLGVRLHQEGVGVTGDGLYRSLLQEERDRDLEEEKRKLYVAMTRARDYLVLAATDKVRKQPKLEMKNEWLDWVIKHLGSCTETSAAGSLQLTDITQDIEHERSGWSIKVVWDAMIPKSPIEEDHKKDEWPAWVDHSTSTHLVPDMQMVFPLLQPIEADHSSILSSLSVSDWMEYMRCPRAYYMRKVLGWTFTIEENAQLSETKMPARLQPVTLGNIVHRVCEKVDEIDESSSPSLALLIERSALREGLDVESSQAAVSEVLPYVQAYVQSPWYRMIREGELANVISELPFHYQFQGLTISGVIDKILVHRDGTATLLDFKTNRLSSSDSSQIEKTAHSYLPQVHLYSLIIEDLLGTPMRDAHLLFLEKNVSYEVDVRREALERHKSEFEQIAHFLLLHRSEEDYTENCEKEYCLCQSSMHKAPLH